MDAASISSDRLAQVQSQASILMFRKALDLQQSMALQLLQALPPVPAGSNPTATVGNSVDTYA
ncbi:MAG: YjfB family protein [Rhodocyclaceae bacterium]|nr:YjfB family protein [Rhodocyclaceae bacterium]